MYDENIHQIRDSAWSCVQVAIKNICTQGSTSLLEHRLILTFGIKHFTSSLPNHEECLFKLNSSQFIETNSIS